jgi:dihydropteroate synthase
MTNRASYFPEGFPEASPSRTEFISQALGAASKKTRDWETAAIVAPAILGGMHIVRVHDVAETPQVARVTDARASAALRPVGPPSK